MVTRQKKCLFLLDCWHCLILNSPVWQRSRSMALDCTPCHRFTIMSSQSTLRVTVVMYMLGIPLYIERLFLPGKRYSSCQRWFTCAGIADSATDISRKDGPRHSQPQPLGVDQGLCFCYRLWRPGWHHHVVSSAATGCCQNPHTDSIPREMPDLPIACCVTDMLSV